MPASYHVITYVAAPASGSGQNYRAVISVSSTGDHGTVTGTGPAGRPAAVSVPRLDDCHYPWLRVVPDGANAPPPAGKLDHGRTAFARRQSVRIDLMASKLRRPAIRPGTVPRWSLIERLARDGSRPIVSVVAPPGFGKTTLLSQWASRSGLAFAWVSVDERDNDPKVLLTYIAEALDAIEPIDEQVFDALSSPGRVRPGTVVPRLGGALWPMTTPVVLVLDDVHMLHDPGCGAVMSVLADHMPGGSRLVLAGRDEPPLEIPRLRAAGKVVEIGPGDLALTREEASPLLREAGVALSEDDVAELHRRTEGWPAGLYLAALSLREGGIARVRGGRLRRR